MRASFANIHILLLWLRFLSKRAVVEGGEREIINDSIPGECKPQKPESPGTIHAQEGTEVAQLQNTEISAVDELPKDAGVNVTASGVVQPTRSTEPGTEKLLTNCKVAVSRSESDFEPPPCNCPGIYIFFLLVFLFKCTVPAGLNIPTASWQVGYDLICLISFSTCRAYFIFVSAFVDSVRCVDCLCLKV